MVKGWAAVSARHDVLAGLTVWAVLVPESLAYATIAGVSPVVGLYAAVPSLLIYAVLGSSRHLIVAPMSATAALSAGIVGLALTIIIGQVPPLFGVEKGEGDFFAKSWHVLTELGSLSLPTTVVGLGSLAIVLVLRRFLPLVPGSLVAVVLGIAAVALLGLDDRGVDIVGPIQSGLPAVAIPGVPLSDYLSLAGPAVGVALVGFAEGLGAAKTYAARHGYTVDPDTELVGLGGANIGAGLTSGMVVNGSLSKTAVNGGAGARSQLSGIVVAALTLVTLLLLTGLFQQLPEATLAAVVIAAVIDLVDFGALRRFRDVWTTRLARIHHKTARADFLGALAALLGVLLFDTLPGLVIGVVDSLALLLQRASQPYVPRLKRDRAGAWVDAASRQEGEEASGVAVLRIESGLFFANADHVRDRILQQVEPDTRAVVVAGESIPTIDLTAALMLDEVAGQLGGRGVRLVLAHPLGQVRDVLHTVGTESIPLFESLDEAVAAARRPNGSATRTEAPE